MTSAREDVRIRRKMYSEAEKGLRNWILVKNRHNDISCYPEGDKLINYCTFGNEKNTKVVSKKRLPELIEAMKNVKEANKKYRELKIKLWGE